MPCFAPVCFRKTVVLVVLTVVACAESHAIEMFTYFGDGSRIGLPSLEVPIEAYPGIPLRRDRLRARRRGVRMPPTTAAPGAAGSITIRAMTPPVIEDPAQEASSASTYRKTPQVPSASDESPVAPEPEDLLLPPSP